MSELHSLKKSTFDKGFTPNYTEAIYRISEVIDHGLTYAYRLRDAFDDSKEPLLGEFYTWELIAADKPDTFVIEDILRLKTVRGRTYGLTKFLGYDKKDSQWRELTAEDLGSLSETTVGKEKDERKTKEINNRARGGKKRGRTVKARIGSARTASIKTRGRAKP